MNRDARLTWARRSKGDRLARALGRLTATASDLARDLPPSPRREALLAAVWARAAYVRALATLETDLSLARISAHTATKVYWSI